MTVEVAAILALIVINGILSGAEIAVVGLRRTRLDELLEAGRPGASYVARLRRDPESFLATVQIGITVVGATAAAFGGSKMAARLAPLLKGIPFLAEWAEPLALALVIGMVSFLSLVLGELVPKSLALRAAEPYALFIARPLVSLSRIAHPFVRLLTSSSNLILRLFGDRTSFTEARLSSDELQQLIDEASTVGSVHPRAGEIAGRALELGGLYASDVMVPRRAMRALARNASPAEIREAVFREGHARLPVYEDTPDRIVGYIATRDVLALLARGQAVDLAEILNPPHFVPEATPAVNLLQELRERRIHLAFVVDEFGGVAGLVTLEDLLEELVGEIFSEGDAQAPPVIRRQADGSTLVQGTVPIRDLNRELDLGLPEGDSWSTIAGLCLFLAGSIPRAGTRLTAEDGTVLEVVEASVRRVRSVRVIPSPRPAPEAP